MLLNSASNLGLKGGERPEGEPAARGAWAKSIWIRLNHYYWA